jgi:hypothetical protein
MLFDHVSPSLIDHLHLSVVVWGDINSPIKDDTKANPLIPPLSWIRWWLCKRKRLHCVRQVGQQTIGPISSELSHRCKVRTPVLTNVTVLRFRSP